MIVPPADQIRLSHILADDLQPRIEWAYALEQAVAAGGDQDSGATFAAYYDGTNNMVYVARAAGTAHNGNTVTLTNDGANIALAVTETATTVTVHLATDGGSVVTSTQQDVFDILASTSTLVIGRKNPGWTTGSALANVGGPFVLIEAVDSSSVQRATVAFPFALQQISIPFESDVYSYPWMKFAEDEPVLAWGIAGDDFPRVCLLSDISDGWFFSDGTYNAYVEGPTFSVFSRGFQWQTRPTNPACLFSMFQNSGRMDFVSSVRMAFQSPDIRFSGTITTVLAAQGGVATSAITSGALPTVSPSSATAFQCDVDRDTHLVVPVTLTNANGTCVVALSPDNSTFTTLVTLTPAVNASVTAATVDVPAGWWVKLTTTNATLGTGHYY